MYRYLAIQSQVNPTFFNNCVREFSFVAGISVMLAVMDLRRFLVYFYVPHLFAQWAIVSINLVQHDGCDVVPIGSPTSGKEVTNFNIARNLTGWLINYLTMK